MNRDPHYHPLTVSDVVDETPDTRSFVFELPTALKQTYHYAAGQFLTFQTTIEGEPVVRCYSMSSSPVTGELLKVTVKRVPGGKMSNWMNDSLSPGDAIEVMPPAGRFVLRWNEAPIVAFAAGSGITPIFSIIKTALTATDREIVLVYANRDKDSIIFAKELERVRDESGGRLSVHHHLDSEQGFLDAEAIAKLVGDRADADFYICGPGPYMDVVEAGLALREIDSDQIFIERFELSDEPAEVDQESETETVEIRFEKKKYKVAYQPGETLLETARRGGARPPFSCQKGTCATCMAFVEKGKAEMRVNGALDEQEVADGWVLTCQAVPMSREVVIDFDQ